MYEKFYGLRESPFNVTPDPRFLYLSPHHREALAHLQYGVQERKGFVTITGEVGTGKTTLIHALLRGFTSNTKTAFIFSTTLTAKGLLKMMVADFGLETKARTKTELLLELNAFLLQQFSSGVNAVLIVDEAQNLSFRLLEEIRMLSNLETDREKLLQIILVGQPELVTKLAMPKLRQLRQRIGSRYHIYPLVRSETPQYVQHRLRVAGSSDSSIFDGRALESIHHWSGGIPRLINMLCDHAMLLGYTYEKRKIGASIVDEAMRDLQVQGTVTYQSWEADEPLADAGKESEQPISWQRRVFRSLAIVSGLLLGVVLLGTPILLREHQGNSVIKPSESGAPVAPWSSLAPHPEREELAFSGEDAELPLEEQAGKVMQVDRDGRFSVHVASFRELSQAKDLEKTIRQRGLEPVFLVPVELNTSGRWLRVMVGEHETRDAALEAAKDYLVSGLFGYAHPRRLSQSGVLEQGKLALGDVPASQIPTSQGAQDE
jgi:general secretion pathway protein A